MPKLAKKRRRSWKAPGDPAAHPYAIKKRVPFGPLVKRGWTDAPLVPIYGGDGRLWSIEAINADASKDSLKGALKRGGSHPFGKIRGASRVLIAEGLADAAVGSVVDGSPATAAMGKSNLLHTALAVRKLAPKSEIIILADNDLNVPREVQDAARAVGGRVAVPDLEGRKCDFWDLWHERGVEAVQRAIADAKAPDAGEHSSGTGAAPGASCGGEEWPEPKPIQAALHSVPAFDPDTLLPEALRDWIMDEADRMPCPPDFIAAAALVALGAIIGARCAIKPKVKDDWLIVPNLWGGIVGLPSAKKSPSIDRAMKPLARLIAKAMDQHRAAMGAFEADKVGERRGMPRKGTWTASPMNCNLFGKTPERADPATTVEKLGELLRENPQGLLVLRDELVGLVASWEKEGREGDRAFFLEGWNGNSSFDVDGIKCGSIVGGRGFCSAAESRRHRHQREAGCCTGFRRHVRRRRWTPQLPPLCKPR